jgi:isoleucyl-tRNA synthetase
MARSAAYSLSLPGRGAAGTRVLPNDLSALYFDVRKDSLYCDRPDEIRRRAARTVMDEVFERLTAWLSPLTPFTMEEAWQTRFPGSQTNCARVIPETPANWSSAARL